MIVYLYLSIIAVVSILTGVIVTMIERKGFYPKVEKRAIQKKQRKKEKKHLKESKKQVTEPQPDFSSEPVITNAVTIMNMKPIVSEDSVSKENYDIPVLVSAYTVDLSDVVHSIQKEQEQEDIEVLEDKTFIKTEGFV